MKHLTLITKSGKRCLPSACRFGPNLKRHALLKSTTKQIDLSVQPFARRIHPSVCAAGRQCPLPYRLKIEQHLPLWLRIGYPKFDR